jgi:predicted dehydrogenase
MTQSRRKRARPATNGANGRQARKPAAPRRARPATHRKGPAGRVRYAVVGLGYIAQAAVLPAFAHARKNSELSALVSDDPVKLRQLARRYRVPHTFSYADYDVCLASGLIDAVYIALPNSMHRAYTERAAAAGIHVLCEKPMAITEEDCESMIVAAEENDVRLMIAYRLHFEAANLAAIKAVRSGKIGEPRIFTSTFTMNVKEGDIRLDRELGGGTLYDIGIYCIQAARHVFGEEPMEVFAATATRDEPRFGEVEEMASVTLRFPQDQLATFTTSFGAADVSRYEVVGTKGSLRLDPAYDFSNALRLEVTIGSRTTKRTYPKRDQFAPELIAFSEAVRAGVEAEPSGLEGLRDVRIIHALLRSAEIGKPQHLALIPPPESPSPDQEMRRPPVRKPELIHAESPSSK